MFNIDIIRLAQELQVEFAFPTQTLHIASQHQGPEQIPPLRERDDLSHTIEDFAPEGSASQRQDKPITGGYDNG